VAEIIQNLPFDNPSFSELSVQYVTESIKSGNTRESLDAFFGRRAVRVLENLVPGASFFDTFMYFSFGNYCIINEPAS
jgi:hypothetical protein